MTLYVEMAVFALLVVTAIAINNIRNLFATVMLAGIFSLLSAALFLSMDAVDVAFTEAAVGAGIATLLFLGALASTSHGYSAPVRHAPFALVLVCLTGALLIYGTLDIPHYGDPSAPVHQHVNPHYLSQTRSEIDIPNVVTAVLASYRGYDTMGEVVVIFTAGVGVLMLLGRRRRNRTGLAEENAADTDRESG